MSLLNNIVPNCFIKMSKEHGSSTLKNKFAIAWPSDPIGWCRKETSEDEVSSKSDPDLIPLKVIHISDKSDTHNEINQSNLWKLIKECQAKNFRMDGYFLSAFICTLQQNAVFRNLFISCHYPNLLPTLTDTTKSTICTIALNIKLVPPAKEVLDYNWNKRIAQLVFERREVGHAMSWLSTFGGAFSALGDEFEHCAKMAGRISMGQLWLALKLGDPLTVSQCKLFLALSLLQRGYLSTAKRLVRQQYQVAKKYSEVDPRLGRMCHGVWAKLTHAYHLRRNNH